MILKDRRAANKSSVFPSLAQMSSYEWAKLRQSLINQTAELPCRQVYLTATGPRCY